MLTVCDKITIPEWELSFSAIRSQGAGGQNVNKVATAIHLRFDINSSSLPAVFKQRLLETRDRRISSLGVIIIKAQRFRTQEKNKQDALDRLKELIEAAVEVNAKRVATKPSYSAKTKRMDKKTQRGRVKVLRKNNWDD